MYLRRIIIVPLLLLTLAVSAACSGGNFGPAGHSALAVSQASIDVTALPDASFTVARPDGKPIAGPFDTDNLLTINFQLPGDGKFIILFSNDASNYYQAICPDRPGDGAIKLKNGAFSFDGGGKDGVSSYFDITDGGKLLKLKPRFVVVSHDFTSTPGLDFTLKVEHCDDHDPASTSSVQHAALVRGSKYSVKFDSATDLVVYPDSPAQGGLQVGDDGSLSAYGDFANVVSLSGTTATLNAGAYVRFRNDTNWGGTPGKWRLNGPHGFHPTPKFDYDTAAPWDSLVLAGGQSFQVEADGGQRSQLLTVGPGNSIDGFAARGYSFGAGLRSGVLNVDGGTYPVKAIQQDPDVLATIDGVDVVNGGYGSACARVPGEPYSFYLLTDRGPNIDGTNAGEKVFPAPGFHPQIGKFYLYDDTLVKDSTIVLRDAAGNARTGLPRPPGADGNTQEIGKDYAGNVIYDPQGIDSEGLVAASDGTFWVSDEYGPFIVHLAADGTTIGELNPFNGALPKVLAKRRVNKGMEGLTLTPNGTLVGIMQSPLVNPVDNSTTKNSRVSRIVTYKAGVRHEYVYVFDTKDLSSSELTAISDTKFIVDERDGNFFGQAGTTKKVYLIDISGATDVTDPADSPNGKLWAGKTLEQVTFSGLTANGITPVTKTLVLDLSTLSPTYPHDKFEGLAIIDANTIALSNDDDFHVTGSNVLQPKFLFDGTTIDFGEVYFAHTLSPLY